MTPLEDRLQRLEAEIARLTPSVNERPERLEAVARPLGQPAGAPAPRSRGSRLLTWAGSELPKFIFGLLLLYITWGLKDSVDIAIKQRQLDLSYAKEMQGLLRDMGAPLAAKEELNSTAIVIASFGEGSVPALLSELRQGGMRAQAAVSGLELLTLSRSPSLCEMLPRVLASRAQAFDSQAHIAVIKLLGYNACIEVRPRLEQYGNLVEQALDGKDDELLKFLKERPASPAEEYKFLDQAINDALRQLNAAAASQSNPPERFLDFFR